MAEIVQVEPREGSYVTEWRATQIDRSDMAGLSRLLRPIGATVFADLADDSGGVVVVVRSGSNLHAAPGDWVVISPHDKIRIIPHGEFEDIFEVTK